MSATNALTDLDLAGTSTPGLVLPGTRLSQVRGQALPIVPSPARPYVQSWADHVLAESRQNVEERLWYLLTLACITCHLFR